MTKKTDGCKNNPENLSTTKVGEHIPSGFANSAIASFRSIKNKHDAYRGKYVTKFCEFLRQHSMNNNYLKDEKYCKVGDYCNLTGEYRDAALSICNLKYSVPKIFL